MKQSLGLTSPYDTTRKQMLCIKPERIWSSSVMPSRSPILIQHPPQLQRWVLIWFRDGHVSGSEPISVECTPATEVSSEADALPKLVQLKERLWFFLQSFGGKYVFLLLAWSKAFCNSLWMKPKLRGKKSQEQHRKKWNQSANQTIPKAESAFTFLV